MRLARTSRYRSGDGPPSLFTELAGRLLGLDRVGLSCWPRRWDSRWRGPFGGGLVDRPLQSWLAAALDVELLLELRAELVSCSRPAGTEWAAGIRVRPTAMPSPPPNPGGE
jgi:hypothetical protein